MCVSSNWKMRSGAPGCVAPQAARERVGDPPEEALVGLVPDERLGAVDDAAARVAEPLLDQVVELLVEALERGLDVRRELVLDADVVVDGAVAREPGHAEDRVRLLRLRRLREEADAALDRRARIARSRPAARRRAARGPSAFVACGVVEAQAGHDAAARPRRRLDLGVDRRLEHASPFAVVATGGWAAKGPGGG